MKAIFSVLFVEVTCLTTVAASCSKKAYSWEESLPISSVSRGLLVLRVVKNDEIYSFKIIKQ